MIITLNILCNEVEIETLKVVRCFFVLFLFFFGAVITTLSDILYLCKYAEMGIVFNLSLKCLVYINIEFEYRLHSYPMGLSEYCNYL